MKYQIKTVQYGEFIDIFKFGTYADLLNDLANIQELRTVEIVYIKKAGVPLDIDKCIADITLYT